MIEIILFAVVGLCIGSFLNVVIIRVPQNKNIAFPASHCIKCNTPLKWYHNIPLFSWLFLKGKCAFCGEKISIQYPIIEVLTSLLFVLVTLRTDDLFQTYIVAAIFTLLLALSAIDLKYKAVPDNLSMPALILSLFTYDFLPSLQSMLILAGGFALLRILVSWIIKKEAMGEADIIIAGVIGGILGVELGLAAIYISAVISLPAFLIISRKGYELPFIPFLSLGLFITWLFAAQVHTVLESIYG